MFIHMVDSYTDTHQRLILYYILNINIKQYIIIYKRIIHPV